MNRVSSMSRAELVRKLIEPVHPTTVPDGQAACSTSRGEDPNFTDDATVAQLVEHKLTVARELLMRDLHARMKSGPVLSSPDVVREWLILHCAKLEREVFIVLHLDVRGRLIAAEEMFRGGLTECVVHTREVVKSATLERRIDLYAKDCKRIEPQSIQGIELELSGRRVVGADAIGDALRPIIRSAKDEIRVASRAIERIIGRFAGFDLGVYASRGVESPNLYLSGDCLYHAAPYQTGPGLVASLLALLESIPQNHTESVAQLEMKQKRQEDIKRELDRPFEYESKLVELLARQRELVKLLDMDKDEAGTTGMDAEESKQAA